MDEWSPPRRQTIPGPLSFLDPVLPIDGDSGRWLVAPYWWLGGDKVGDKMG